MALVPKPFLVTVGQLRPYLSVFDIHARLIRSQSPHLASVVTSGDFLAAELVTLLRINEDVHGRHVDPSLRRSPKLPASRILRSLNDGRSKSLVALSLSAALGEVVRLGKKSLVEIADDHGQARLLLSTVHSALRQSGAIPALKVHLSRGLPEARRLEALVEVLGGQLVVQDEADVVVAATATTPSDEKCKGQVRVLQLKEDKQQYLVHWLRYPNSYDGWLPMACVLGVPQYQSLPCPTVPEVALPVVPPQFIEDSYLFNEWMEVIDYVDDTAGFLCQAVKRERSRTPAGDVPLRARKAKLRALQKAARADERNVQNTAIIPSHALWYLPGKVHDIEVEAFPDIFLTPPPSLGLTPCEADARKEWYKETRDWLVRTYREVPSDYLSATFVHRSLGGDGSLIIRIHAFLEHWGLINYQLRPEAKQSLHDPALPRKPLKIATSEWSAHEITSLLQITAQCESVATLKAKVLNLQPTWLPGRTVPEILMKFAELSTSELIEDPGVVPVLTDSRVQHGGDKAYEPVTRLPDVEEQKQDFPPAIEPLSARVFAFLEDGAPPDVTRQVVEAVNPSLAGETLALDEVPLETAYATVLGLCVAKAAALQIEEEATLRRLALLAMEKQMAKLQVYLQWLEAVQLDCEWDFHHTQEVWSAFSQQRISQHVRLLELLQGDEDDIPVTS